MGEIKTLKEVEIELWKRAEKRREMFCPLINSKCNPKCVCFVKTRVDETKSEDDDSILYSVNGGYCGNEMFKQRTQDDHIK